jgi:hypothetical protein
MVERSENVRWRYCAQQTTESCCPEDRPVERQASNPKEAKQISNLRLSKEMVFVPCLCAMKVSRNASLLDGATCHSEFHGS